MILSPFFDCLEFGYQNVVDEHFYIFEYIYFYIFCCLNMHFHDMFYLLYVICYTWIRIGAKWAFCD